MFSFFRRKPVFCDIAFHELAQMLTQEQDKPTYRRELLPAARLDFSLESLKVIDGYLDIIRQDALPDEVMTPLVLRVGAYVGEVIRRGSTAQEYHWLAYKEAARRVPLVREIGMCLPVAAVLWSSDDEVCLPLGKVCKFLANGDEDSVYFFARVILQKATLLQPARATT
jgi:hypothetical protein